MKKIIYILSLVIVFISLLFLDAFFDYKVDSLIFNDRIEVILYDFNEDITVSEVENKIEQLHNEKGITILRYLYKGTDELEIYTNDLTIFEKVKSNIIPKGNGEYITDNVEDN
ncbi:MAG: hypothetical protein K2L15_02755, partial [Eubacteriales bacterium]|nr:hypothetical protein [Eubacteriales bacterium]